jgi:hypothetical protein
MIAVRVESDGLMGGDSELLLAREWKSLAVAVAGPPYLQGGRMSIIIEMGMLLIHCRLSRNRILGVQRTTEELFAVVFHVKWLLFTWIKATVNRSGN